MASPGRGVRPRKMTASCWGAEEGTARDRPTRSAEGAALDPEFAGRETPARGVRSEPQDKEARRAGGRSLTSYSREGGGVALERARGKSGASPAPPEAAATAR